MKGISDHAGTHDDIGPLSLEDAWNDVWQRLQHGLSDSSDPFHTAVFATSSEDGADARHVVLRGIDPIQACLFFHADKRSGKLAQIEFDDRVCLVFLGHQVQVRARGVARIADKAETVAAWASVHGGWHRHYASVHAPGTPCLTPDPVLQLGSTTPAQIDDVAGQINFALIEVQVQAIEWLKLVGGGQQRAGFGRSGGRWISTWMVP